MASIARRVALALIAVAWIVQALPATAQTPGAVRAQGRVVPPGETAAATPGGAGGAGGLGLDYREEMRRFVERIGAYARQQRPGFTVIAMNGLELLSKSEEGDETKRAPARTYMRALDGVIVEGLHFGKPRFGEPRPDEQQQAMLRQTELARQAGLKVLVIDYGRTPEVIDGSYGRNDSLDYVGFVADNENLTTIPTHPPRPHGENPNSILAIKDARNFLFVRDAPSLGREDEFAFRLHGTNFDVVVVDVFRGRAPLSPQAVETFKFKKVGSKRLALAHVNIGEAASYRYYWKPDWREGSPAFIGAPLPGNPDGHFVEYWRPEWQSVISGGPESYLYGVIAQGYDGVVIEGLESYQHFEGGETGPSAR